MDELDLPRTAILTPVYPLFKRLIKIFNAVPLETWAWKSPPFYHFAFQGGNSEKGTLVCCPMGASNVAIILEELRAFGTRNAFFLGLAGGVGTRHAPGDLLIPSYAYVGEGTSRYYGAFPLSFPDKELSDCLFGGLCKKRRVFRSPVFTTDGLYRETEGLVREMSARGAGAIDMETSAFFRVSQTLSIRGVALLWVTDLLTEDDWEPHFFDRRLKWSLERHLKGFRNWLFKTGYGM